MLSLRKKGVTVVGYVALVIALLLTATPALATHALNGLLYDSNSCSGSAFAFTHEYNNLTSVGWNDRAGAVQSLNNGHSGSSGRLHRDDNYAGETFSFGNGNWSDCNLSNNFMAKWGFFDLYWNDQASSISIS